MGDILRDSVSGIIGATVCTYIGFPFDYLKARLQNGQSRSVWTCAKETFARAGPQGFFRGVTPALASAMVENSVLFAANGLVRRSLETSIPKDYWTGRENMMSAVAGGLSGVFSAISICPAEVIKIRMQTASPNMRPCASRTALQIFNSSGIRGFFVGVKPLLLRDVPFYFVFFGSYESVLNLISSDKKERSPLDHAFAGAVGGSVAWSLVFPADVIKTRLQSAGRIDAHIWSSVNRTYSEGGIKAFYKGWLPAVVRGFPANGGLLLGVSASVLLLDKIIPPSHAALL